MNFLCVYFQTSLEVWPCVNIMSSVTNVKCEACVEQPATKLALFYGQPYDRTTLKAREDAEKEAPNKVRCMSFQPLIIGLYTLPYTPLILDRIEGILIQDSDIMCGVGLKCIL